MPSPSTHQPTRVLGRYAMYEQFAAGGMATLHYGRLLGRSGFSRAVAIKRLHAHLSEDPDFVAMFLDEARLAARIHHPNVIQTLDVESSEGELFVVLDYVHGDSLSRLLREGRRVGQPATPALVAAVLFGALQGLHAAHEARDSAGQPLDLVHRDVSPHNVLVGTDGIARVLDFGVAKARGRAQTTRVGQLKGKLAYMAPEQLGGRVTRRSDVFSASVVLWEALTGTRLFQGEDEGEIVDRLLHARIPSPREPVPAVTRDLERVVMRGLARDPAERYPTARDMAVDLERHAELATPIQVGEWVERVSGPALALRAERVSAIEADFAAVVDMGPAGNALLAPHRPPAASVTGATTATVAVPGLAKADGRAMAEAVEPTRTAIATVSDLHTPRRRTRLVSVASAVIGGGALVGVLWAVLGAGGPRSPREAAAVVTAPPPVVDDPAPPQPPSAVPSDSAPAEEATPVQRPATDVQVKRSLVLPSRRHAACTPPYTIDGRGVRHYKPECL